MKSILVVDDDPVFRSAISKDLLSAGWTVFEAGDGEAGIRTALETKPDAVLCNLLMPKGNGFHLCRVLRLKRDILPQVVLILTTGRTFENDRLNALEAGADDYMVKPFKPAELIELVEKHSRDKAAAGPSPASTAPQLDTRNRLRFWGVRGSIPTPGPATVFYGGNTSCLEVRADDEIIILDSGSGIRALGMNLIAEFGDKPIRVTLLITHTHWDHIQGFPFFPVAYNPRNQLKILGFEGSRQGLESTLIGQMESTYFPIALKQMPGNIGFEELKGMEFNVGRVRAAATFVNHPGVTVGYRINTSTGSAVYIPDHEPVLRMRLQADGTPVESDGSMDFAKAEDQKLIDFIEGADVLIVDSQYDAAEYEKHVGWGHSCVDDSIALAIKSRVKQLYLFHHDPSHNDAWIASTVAYARAVVAQSGSALQVDAAREGLDVVLNFAPTPVAARA